MVHYRMVHYKPGESYITVHSQTVHVTKRYIIKRYCYKMVHYKTVHGHNGMLQNITLQLQSTGLHQPMDWLRVKPNIA
jgi:hypothetical protein